MKVLTKDLIGTALDWAVAKAQQLVEGGPYDDFCIRRGELYLWCNGALRDEVYSPTINWSQGGSLLNQHKISRTIDHSGLWIAYAGYNLNDEQRHMQCDRSELVAGLRCLVALNLGEVVDVPEELL